MTPKPMKLESLTIFRSSLEGEHLQTTVKFSGYRQEVVLKLDPALGARILDMCMDEVVAAIKDSATDAQAAIQNAQRLQLTASSEDNDETV